MHAAGEDLLRLAADHLVAGIAGGRLEGAVDEGEGVVGAGDLHRVGRLLDRERQQAQLFGPVPFLGDVGGDQHPAAVGAAILAHPHPAAVGDAVDMGAARLVADFQPAVEEVRPHLGVVDRGSGLGVAQEGGEGLADRQRPAHRVGHVAGIAAVVVDDPVVAVADHQPVRQRLGRRAQPRLGGAQAVDGARGHHRGEPAGAGGDDEDREEGRCGRDPVVAVAPGGAGDRERRHDAGRDADRQAQSRRAVLWHAPPPSRAAPGRAAPWALRHLRTPRPAGQARRVPAGASASAVSAGCQVPAALFQSSEGETDLARIAVVDDERDIREMLADYLGHAGHEVVAAGDGRGLEALLAAGPPPDLFILDLGLPGEDGFALARMLRQRLDPGIIILTGAGDLVDRVVGLEIGADDYVRKPVELPELAARIAAVLRRRRPAGAAGPAPAGPSFGPYSLDLRAFCLRDAAGAPVELSAMEVDLVAAFATNPGRVLTRDELMRLAPPRDDDSNDRSIDHRVTRLRRKLETDPEHPQLIKTVRGVGYVHTR